MDQSTFQKTVLEGVKTLADDIDKLEKKVGEIDGLKGYINQHAQQLSRLRKGALTDTLSTDGRKPGKMSNEAARSLGAAVLLNAWRKGQLEAFIPDDRLRVLLVAEAREVAGISEKALSTSDIPLPSTYSGELNELIAEFGVARRMMTDYPMGPGINYPPRMKSRPAFDYVDMSAAFGEKTPQIEFATLDSRKIGGIVVTPREIDEQSIVRFGMLMAQYGAIEFARKEDDIAFLADGSATYKLQKGVVKVASDNNRLITLGSGLTAPSDAVLDDFRQMRQKVGSACIARGAYYINQTWESRLRSFRTQQEPDVFMYRPDGTATLDGFPIIWTEVLTPFGTAAQAGKPLAVFGALSFWFFGKRGAPRIDTSADVYFANDLLATRFLEELAFDYMSLDAACALKTAAN